MKRTDYIKILLMMPFAAITLAETSSHKPEIISGSPDKPSLQHNDTLHTPTDLTVVTEDGCVVLSWLSDSDKHLIHYSTISFDTITEENYAPLGKGHYKNICVTGANQATIHGLKNGQRYFFVVTAVNGFQGPASNEVSIISPTLKC